MNCLSRLSNTVRAAALVLATLAALLTVDTTGALAHHRSAAVRDRLVAAAVAPSHSVAAAQVRS